MTPPAPEPPAADARPIAITLGDPCGIGPEIVLKACADRSIAMPLRVVGDAGLLAREAARLGLPMPARIDSIVDLPVDLRVGQVDARAGDAAWRFIVHAAGLALRGEVRAVVTAPIAKEAMHAAGHRFPGHTELLAELAGGADVRMMLANPELRTVLVSIHVSLRDALDRVTRDNVLQTIVIADAALRRAGIARPRIAVAGLNPHAGEAGMFGREELDTIGPAIAEARARGIEASGPFPPDTVFMRARGLREFDLVVAMYHDQGLIPVKYLGIDDGVNVTLGLPFVRTSPDHGTAFDLAGRPGPDGRGLASPRSLIAAILEADALSAASCRPMA
ncbi:MAG TPA: 4-hydroxythreonine-4-phosphate dehydrogenase PdxA [Burkholderiaceae bacterium]|jgi:4-hydroxythreonine-4-phosphate dehydrogenase|nr:4-hydroxythreonine-4-phosphate dehydrogenase PdxA [Burkholderiaceae bacterium]HRA79140.1 4-hydroxythreonine-4-phosphate dehydrogenase PdxA [Burkholderiaceae bacterium]